MLQLQQVRLHFSLFSPSLAIVSSYTVPCRGHFNAHLFTAMKTHQTLMPKPRPHVTTACHPRKASYVLCYLLPRHSPSHTLVILPRKTDQCSIRRGCCIGLSNRKSSVESGYQIEPFRCRSRRSRWCACFGAQRHWHLIISHKR